MTIFLLLGYPLHVSAPFRGAVYLYCGCPLLFCVMMDRVCESYVRDSYLVFCGFVNCSFHGYSNKFASELTSDRHKGSLAYPTTQHW